MSKATIRLCFMVVTVWQLELPAVFLHKSIAIQSNSLYLLYTGFPAILDRVFTGVANTSSTPTGWGWAGSSWLAKATLSLRTGK